MSTATKNLIAEGLELPVMESFYTIQGEGANTGKAAYFIRLGGCDVGCVWCDVKESWEADAHPIRKIEDIVAEAEQHPADLVVITGGEPAMYNLEPLTALLISKGLKPCIETSGAHELTGTWHWICFSPKKFKAPVESIYKVAHELKVVVFHKTDVTWAVEHATLINKECLLYLQPEWSKAEQMMPLIVDHVKAHPEWNVSLQTHKYLNIP